jgi:hypothetical protein
VLASSNSTLDITGSFNSARRRVQELEAQRAGLLKSLANAVTLNEIESIKAQLRIVNGRLRAAHTRLDEVRTRAGYSTVSVELVSGRGGPVPQHKGTGGGFTVSRAWHDAVHILSVSAAVLLVSLAVLLPLALIVLLGWWARRTAARRRREQALDAV